MPVGAEILFDGYAGTAPEGMPDEIPWPPIVLMPPVAATTVAIDSMPVVLIKSAGLEFRGRVVTVDTTDAPVDKCVGGLVYGNSGPTHLTSSSRLPVTWAPYPDII